MIRIIKVSGFENEVVEKLSFKDEKRGLLGVSSLIFNKVVDGERENVLLRLMGRFKSLRYEDLEEVYNDGCLVLWDKMLDKEFKLKEKSMVGYLVRICRNIGMHYLRKVNEDIESLDRIMERGYEMREEDERGIEELFDVMEEIARRIGYRNGNSVKSKKNKVLRKMMEMMQEGTDFNDLPEAA